MWRISLRIALPAAAIPYTERMALPCEDSLENTITKQLLPVAEEIRSNFSKSMTKIYQVLDEVSRPLIQKNFAMWEITNDLAYKQVYDKAQSGMLDEYAARRIAQMYCRALGLK